MTLARRPIKIVEIDLPQCTRTYGSLPCTAVLGTTGARKCFNSRATCQSVTAFSPADMTLRFGENVSGARPANNVFPALTSVSARPGRVNLSGIDPKSTPLGQRARVTVVLQDFTWQDSILDPYRAQRVTGAAQADGIGYDPATRGTFFTRLHARWPYYLGRSLRVLTGYEGDALGAMRVAHYVITEWSGPNAAGVVTITAQDILNLADPDKAQAPRPSQGKLAADITGTATAFTLTPATIGDEYDAAGLIAVGRELMRFTRVGDDFTITERGVAETDVKAHSAGDVVQQALEYVNQPADAIIADLLVTFAGVSSAFIDSATWQAEAERWLGGIVFSAIIAKPEGVATLIGELCQHGIMVYWDEIDQELKFYVNKPLEISQTYVPLTDGAQIVEGSGDIEDSVEERASQILFWHGVIDPTDTVNDGKNFKRLHVAADLIGEGPDLYGESRVKEIFSRWFGTSGDDANAGILADRLLNRYRNTPRTLTCDIDRKDLASINLTTLVEVSSRLVLDDTGAALPYPMQVRYREETSGERIRIEAQTFTFDGRFGFIMLDTAPDYDAASPTEIAEGCFIVDDTLLQFPDGTGPYVLF